MARRGWVFALVALTWGCEGEVDQTMPARVGVSAGPALSGRNAMAAGGDGLQHIEEGRLPQRRHIDERRLLEGRDLPERAECARRRCVDVWEDRGHRLVVLRVRTGIEPGPAPEHVTLLWGGSSGDTRAKTALRDAVRDAPPEQQFSLMTADWRPRVWARSGADGASKQSVIDAFGRIGAFSTDVHSSLDAAFDESARSGVAHRRVVAVFGANAPSLVALPRHTEGLLSVGREGVYGVGVFSEDTSSSSNMLRDLARAGGGPRGHLTGRDDEWARAALGSPLVDAGEVTLDVRLPDGVHVEDAWGGEVRVSGEEVEVEFGRLVGYTGEELFDAVVLLRVSREEGAAEDVSLRIEGEEVEPTRAELEDMSDAAVTLETLEEALGAFEAGSPERALEITRAGEGAVAARGRDARLLGALEDGLEDFIGR